MKTPSKTELTDPNAVPAEMPAWFQPFAEQLTRQGEQLQSISAFQQQLQQQQIVNELRSRRWSPTPPRCKPR